MNLNLVIDTSLFKPFDISPALLILHDYRDRYDKYQEQLQKIAEENGLYILPDTEDNKQYRDTMDRYKADFEAAASDFSNHMNLLNQKQLLNLFRRLRSEITPINKAIEAYNKDIDKITALGTDVTVANRDNRKISDYYGGINPGILYRSNKSIQATAAGVMQGLDNALMGSPEIAGDIANQYYILKQKGIDGQDALLKILSGRPYLRTEEGVLGVSQVMDALNTVYNQFAFDEGTPENKLIWELVVTGAIQGILAPRYSLLTNKGFQTKSEKIKDMYDLAYAKSKAEDAGYFVDETTGEITYNEDERNRRAKIIAESKPPKEDTVTTGLNIYNTSEYKVLDGKQLYGGIYGGESTDYISLTTLENWTIYDSKGKAVTDDIYKAKIIRLIIAKYNLDGSQEEAPSASISNSFDSAPDTTTTDTIRGGLRNHPISIKKPKP